MFKNWMIVFFSLSVTCFALTRWGIPDYMWTSSYSINDYAGIANNLKRSIAHKNRFNEQIEGKLKSKYPNINFSRQIDRENSYATVANFLNDNTNSSEFVFFSGHGSYDFILLRDGIVSSASGKSFGNWTRWVIFDACLTLNADWPQLKKWFDGVHALLGSRSKSWEFIKAYDCFFTCDHYRSEDQFNKFAARFITNGETIWSAYHNAVKEAIYNNGGNGIEPVIVNATGNADNGQYVDFSEERFQNVYNGAFNSQNGATNIVYWWHSYTYGKPQY